MTIKEAQQQGISRLRLPEWNDQAYLQLDLRPDGLIGVWATLYDPHSEDVKVLVPELETETRFEAVS